MTMAEKMRKAQAEVARTRNTIMRRLRRKGYIALEPPARKTLYSSPSQLPIEALSEALRKPPRQRGSRARVSSPQA
jgi:outer membrane protein TolC